MQKNIYYAICENGDFEEVVRINNKDTVSVKLSFLLRYATAKQMAVLLFFDIRASICGSLKSYGLTKYSDVRKEKDLYYPIKVIGLGDFKTYNKITTAGLYMIICEGLFRVRMKSDNAVGGFKAYGVAVG